jgi:uncharacterized protein (AIM24 family)
MYQHASVERSSSVEVLAALQHWIAAAQTVECNSTFEKGRRLARVFLSSLMQTTDLLNIREG